MTFTNRFISAIATPTSHHGGRVHMGTFTDRFISAIHTLASWPNTMFWFSAYLNQLPDDRVGDEFTYLVEKLETPTIPHSAAVVDIAAVTIDTVVDIFAACSAHEDIGPFTAALDVHGQGDKVIVGSTFAKALFARWSSLIGGPESMVFNPAEVFAFAIDQCAPIGVMYGVGRSDKTISILAIAILRRMLRRPTTYVICHTEKSPREKKKSLRESVKKLNRGVAEHPEHPVKFIAMEPNTVRDVLDDPRLQAQIACGEVVLCAHYRDAQFVMLADLLCAERPVDNLAILDEGDDNVVSFWTRTVNYGSNRHMSALTHVPVGRALLVSANHHYNDRAITAPTIEVRARRVPGHLGYR